MGSSVRSVRPDQLSLPLPMAVLDVREDDEWDAGHVEGATHIPMHEVPARLDEVPADGEVLVVCRVGGRSAYAAAWLARQGFDVLNLDGGLDAWARHGLPLVSDGPAAPHVA